MAWAGRSSRKVPAAGTRPTGIRRLADRVVLHAAVATLLISAAAAGFTVMPSSALAAGTVLFNQPFHDNTVDGPAGSVSVPATPTKTNEC